MGAFKQFLASDIIVTPLEVNKDFTFQGDSVFTGSNVGIDRFLGRNFLNSSSIFEEGIYGSSIYDNINAVYGGTDVPTGEIAPMDFESLIYYSVRHLYYSNYLSSSYGDNVSTASIVLGAIPEGNVLTGSINGPRYDNYLQTTLTYPKYFPTTSKYSSEENIGIGVISIPTKLYGDYIRPGSFYFSAESGSLTDDGEGNIYLSSSLSTSSVLIGNIFYPHGLVVVTGNPTVFPWNTGSIFSSIVNFVSSSNVTCSFSSSYTIYETQYKCTIGENEFNFTLNPSISSGGSVYTSSNGTFYTPDENLVGFATASYFNPYITTVGLYDEQQNLLAIGKLSQPLPSSPTTDTTIIINIDR
jgi:hypothetical protein